MKLGFIGGGNMATALIGGAVVSHAVECMNISVFDTNDAAMTALKARYGVCPAASAEALIQGSDIVVLCVKPNVLGTVLAASRAALAGKAVISIVAGFTVEMLRAALDPSTRLMRVMPNTPAMCGQGMTALSLLHSLSEDERCFAERLFGALGRFEWVGEDKMDAVVGVSGSGPAYVYLFIEALADAGVRCGLPRAQAIDMAAQTVKGAAEMVLTTGRHPGALKDDVCSPGGTTIEAVRTLEEKGLRSAVMEAAIAAHDKSAAMRAR